MLGSIRVFEAAAGSGEPALVHASSVGAYSPSPKDRPVDASWPGAAYCREKAYLERFLDAYEQRHTAMRVSACDRGSSSSGSPRRSGDGSSHGRVQRKVRSSRTRAELDWEPRRTAAEAAQEFLDGLHAQAGMNTAPLASRSAREAA